MFWYLFIDRTRSYRLPLKIQCLNRQARIIEHIWHIITFAINESIVDKWTTMIMQRQEQNLKCRTYLNDSFCLYFIANCKYLKNINIEHVYENPRVNIKCTALNRFHSSKSNKCFYGRWINKAWKDRIMHIDNKIKTTNEQMNG